LKGPPTLLLKNGRLTTNDCAICFKIARYGLNIAELNDMIALGFAGKTVGNVFEGEKRFDMVVWINPIGVISMI
jgi:hypothetical protein